MLWVVILLKQHFTRECESHFRGNDVIRDRDEHDISNLTIPFFLKVVIEEFIHHSNLCKYACKCVLLGRDDSPSTYLPPVTASVHALHRSEKNC